jgi:anthranilate phosphoribosyltransferase
MHRKAELARLIAGDSLTAEVTAERVGKIIDGELPPEYAGAWLAAMAAKGEEVAEIVGAAEAMRARSLRLMHDCPLLLDVCGTGGDGLGTINLSTVVAFVVAACGVPVAKHGNRAASSQCGSADVLEAVGVDLDLSPEEARNRLEAGGVAFLFAQQYHPAMRRVAPLRGALGVRTIFNLLGPLTNPARATHQVIGVAQPRALERMALAAAELGVKAGAVVHAACGLDEVAGEGLTTILFFRGRELRQATIDPAHYGIRATLDDLRGGDVEVNARALLAILEGERSPRAEVVALNAAVALEVTGHCPDFETGLAEARGALRNGQARAQLARLQ